MRSQGYDFSAFRFIEASYLALAEAIDLGHREPLLDIDPASAAGPANRAAARTGAANARFI